ncbi:hypothetical protein Salat_2662100 [Sesamum alatum]|uniref:Uncharacterized protein n=1 Tax=Sesamum alatum TaxID=300844 RepID=A0AAE2CB15_9LAMI|nr:hypothetical protein Salat_2662100 [Sesamum alatum]
MNALRGIAGSPPLVVVPKPYVEVPTTDDMVSAPWSPYLALHRAFGRSKVWRDWSAVTTRSPSEENAVKRSLLETFSSYAFEAYAAAAARDTKRRERHISFLTLNRRF